MILRIGRLTRKNEHVNLRVVCPHHCSDQRIPSPHSEPQGTAGVQHPLRRPSMQVERSPNVQLRGPEAICVSRLDRASLPLQLPVWVALRASIPVSIPGVWAHDAQAHDTRLTWSSADFGRPRAYKLRNPGLSSGRWACRPLGGEDW